MEHCSSLLAQQWFPRIDAIKGPFTGCGADSRGICEGPSTSSPGNCTLGQWSDSWGRRHVILICLLVTCLSYIILGISQNIFFVIFARIVAGFFKHSQTLSRALLADIAPAVHRSEVFGTFNAVSSIGFIIGPTIGGHLFEMEGGFFIVCLTGASFFFLSFVICWLFLPSVNVKTECVCKISTALNPVHFFQDHSWSVLWDIFLIRFLLSFSTLIYRANFYIVVRDRYDATAKTVGYLTSFQGLVSASAGFFTGHISSFYHSSLLEIFHASLLLFIALCGLSIAPSITILFACLIPFCVSTAVIRVSSSAITVSRSPPDKIGLVTGFGQCITSLARMLTPLCAGLAQEFSILGPSVVAIITAGLGLGLTGFITFQRKLKEE